MPYVERVTRAGKTIEVERYFTSRYKKPGIKRGDKVKPTKEEQKKVNTRAAERKLRLLLNANFGYGDYHLELDYIRKKGQPDRSREQMRKDMDIFLRELRKECKKAGIIDNPPDIGLNVVNALAITDEVIVPVKVDEDALEGLDIVTEQIEDAKAFNPALKLAGVLITSYQNTDGEAAGVEWLEQNTDFTILGIIRYSKKVAENTFLRKPIYEYSPCCAAAQGYKKFVTAYTGKGWHMVVYYRMVRQWLQRRDQS